MLQKYDTLKSSLLLALAAAGGAVFTGAAHADKAGCALDNGYATQLAAYVSEATACIETAQNIDTGLADGLFEALNAERAANGLAPLNRRASLDAAANAHALDMSVRIYADHADLEGRDHLHRIRAFDRKMLVGDSGSNVTVSVAAADADGVHARLKQDALNHQNMLREGFTDVGIGVVEEMGQFYVVQVFAAAEGDLRQALPVSGAGSYALTTEWSGRDRQVEGWGLFDTASGEALAASKMPRLRLANLDASESAELDILIAVRNDTYVLKGPLVSGGS